MHFSPSQKITSIDYQLFTKKNSRFKTPSNACISLKTPKNSQKAVIFGTQNASNRSFLLVFIKKLR